MSDDVKEIRRKLKARPAGKGPAGPKGLSTGSTLLNLACSGCPDWGFARGTYNMIVGSSDSGKTFLALSCLAEAAHDPAFGGYRLIYDGPEGGAQMDLGRLFGRKLADRLEAPVSDEMGPRPSETVDEFYLLNLDAALKHEKPCVYVLDSMDCLTSAAEEKSAEKQKKALQKDEEGPGSYGDGKAKVNSAGLRRAMRLLQKTGSILVIINQERDKVGGLAFDTRTYSGGRALRFYASVLVWSSCEGKIKRDVGGKPREIGTYCKMQVRRSRTTGRGSAVTVPIYFTHGIDDTGSLVDYLVGEGHWKKSAGRVDAPEFGFSGAQEKLIQKVEGEGLLGQLKALAAGKWAEIEEACAVQRKARY